MTRYKVIAPVVVCKAMTADGIAYKHIQCGGFVPDEAGAEWIEHHLRDNMIALVPEPDSEPSAPPAAPSPAGEDSGAPLRSARGRASAEAAKAVTPDIAKGR